MSEKTKPGNRTAGSVLVQSAQVQLAAYKAAVEFWGQWAHGATKWSKALDKGLQDYKKDPSKSQQVLNEIGDAAKVHFSDVAKLPQTAWQKFIAEMETRESPKKGDEKPRSAKSAATGTGAKRKATRPRSKA